MIWTRVLAWCIIEYCFHDLLSLISSFQHPQEETPYHVFSFAKHLPKLYLFRWAASFIGHYSTSEWTKRARMKWKLRYFSQKGIPCSLHFTHRHLMPTVLKLSSSSLVISCLNYFIPQWLYRSLRMLKKVTYENTEVGIERKHRFVKDTRIKISCIAQIIKY